MEWNADYLLSPVRLRRRRNFFAASDPAGNRFGQTVGGLHQRIPHVVSCRKRFGQMREPDVETLALGKKLTG